ncbi:MAG: hypothetical protein CMF12_12315 [Idiomarina sp.]|uniref:hypothetical protein n=1 Tax=Idiomarina sp. TaxID=1874361 RepID=UPI000C6700E2|nr:hypothetical protein [Idiomarina sp.]MBT43299.1 hypothetical protein [Idiomarina sp.]
MKVCFFNSDKYATFEEANTEEAVYWTDNDVSLVEPCQSSNVSQLDELIECLEQQAECLLGDRYAVEAGVIPPETGEFINLRDLREQLSTTN